ncbi:helix-turn-helix domain-containing protein [Rossellomorea sp. NPDC071047]|uniref:helix-turn-helix domain-containing protein n=1 Tax=Rossellomorea sp. NPDC071047 TaxID=3390675 RepID=UPI003D022452
MEVGSKIKYYRVNKKMTQEELASGIISVSYLSKIENNQVDTGMDIIALLCEKLEISPELPVDSDVPNLCMDFFRNLLNRSIDDSKELFTNLEPDIESINHFGYLRLFEIQKIKYFMLTGDLPAAEAQIEALKRKRYHFTRVEEYYWHKFNGNYRYLNSDFTNAYDSYKKAQKLFNFDIYYYEEEESDLNYSISLTTSKLWNTYLSINYAQKALEYYQRKYNVKRCIECHLLLGINYGRNKEYKNAISSYKVAKKLATTIKSQSLLSSCEQNLGHLYSLQDKSDAAIEHFKSSYKNKEADDKTILNPIFSLVKEYHRTSRNEEAKNWLNKGFKVIKHLNIHNSPRTLDFQVYDYLINNYSQEFEKFMIQTVIPFYEQKKSKMELSKSLKLLAQYYFDDRKYKNSSIYFAKAYSILESI